MRFSGDIKEKPFHLKHSDGKNRILKTESLSLEAFETCLVEIVVYLNWAWL